MGVVGAHSGAILGRSAPWHGPDLHQYTSNSIHSFCNVFLWSQRASRDTHSLCSVHIGHWVNFFVGDKGSNPGRHPKLGKNASWQPPSPIEDMEQAAMHSLALMGIENRSVKVEVKNFTFPMCTMQLYAQFWPFWPKW